MLVQILSRFNFLNAGSLLSSIRLFPVDNSKIRDRVALTSKFPLIDVSFAEESLTTTGTSECRDILSVSL